MLAESAPSYHRATRMQAPLALVGSPAAILAWIRGRPRTAHGGLARRRFLAMIPRPRPKTLPSAHAVSGLEWECVKAAQKKSSESKA